MSKALLFRLFTIVFLCASFWSQAQVARFSTQGLSYQGAAREANGLPLAHHDITLRISIVSDTTKNPDNVLYWEVRKVTTNALGLYHFNIGTPGYLAKSNTTLLNIDWQSGIRYIGVEIDPNAGNDFAPAGYSIIGIVPYALHAISEGSSGFNYWKSLPGNENKTPQDYLNGIMNRSLVFTNSLTLQNNSLQSQINNSTSNLVDLSKYLDNTDNQILSLSGQTLTISGGNSITLPPASDNQYLNVLGNSLSISNANTVQLISSVQQNLTNNVLNTAVNGLNSNPLDLSKYLDNTDSQNLTLTGNQLSIANGNTVTLPSADGTETKVQGGTNINISGNGSASSPYQISNTYTTPIASDAVLGAVKVGTGLNVDSDGTLSTNADADKQNLTLTGNQLSIANGNTVTLPSADGTETIVQGGTNINISGNGSASSPYQISNTYTTPIASEAVLGAVKVGTGLNVDADGTLSTNADADKQNLTLTGNQLSIANGNTVTLPSADGTETKVQGGTNINILGNGSASSPYIINNTYVDADPSATNELNTTLSSTNNTLSLSDAGGTLTAQMVNLVENTLTGNSLTTSVNGVPSTAVDLSGIVNTNTTNTLTSSGNTLTSTVNGKVATASSINTVENTLTSNKLTTKVNGILGNEVDLTPYLDNTDAQTLTNTAPNTMAISGGNTASIVNTVVNDLTANKLKTTVNGVAGNEVDLTPYVNAAETDPIANAKTVNVAAGTGLSVTGTPSQTLGNNPNYSLALNPATTTTLGGVIIGDHLSIDASGKINALAPADGTETKIEAVDETLTVVGSGTTTDPYKIDIGFKKITEDDLGSGSVTGPKLGPNAVTTSKISDGTIKNIDIDDAAGIEVKKLLGATNGQVLTSVDSIGVWKDLPAQPTASNGLTKDMNDIQLGGDLTKATTLKTSSTNTLALEGLSYVESNKVLLTINNNNVIGLKNMYAKVKVVTASAFLTKYSVFSADYGNVVYIDNGTQDFQVEIPNANLDPGFNVIIIQGGTGTVTILNTVNYASRNVMAGQYSTVGVFVVKPGTNILTGEVKQP